MRSLFAGLRSLTLPFGAGAGLRIVLDGILGLIRFFNASNELRGELGPDLWYVGDVAGARVQLDPDGGLRVTDDDGSLVIVADATQGIQVRDGDTGIVQATITHKGFTFTNDDATESIVFGTTPGLPTPRYASMVVAAGAAGVVPTPSVTPFGANDLELRHAALFDASQNLSATTIAPPGGFTEIVDATNHWATGGSTVAVGLATRQPASVGVLNFVDSSNLFNRVLGTTIVVEGVEGGPAPTVGTVASGWHTFTATTTSFTIARGAVAAGELMLAYVVFANDGGSVPSTWTTPRGWVFLGAQFVSLTNTLAVGVWAKVAAPGEPAAETIRLNKLGGATPTQVGWTVVTVANAKLLPEYTDIRINGQSVPRGRVVPRTNSSGNVTLGPGAPSAIFSLPGTAVTVTNSTGGARRYQATAGVRARMFAGTDGVYRVLVTDNAGTAIAGSTTQVHTNVAGPAGEVGGPASAEFVLAPGASQVVAAGGQRISGGNSSDTLETGFLYVDDIGE